MTCSQLSCCGHPESCTAHVSPSHISAPAEGYVLMSWRSGGQVYGFTACYDLLQKPSDRRAAIDALARVAKEHITGDDWLLL